MRAAPFFLLSLYPLLAQPSIAIGVTGTPPKIDGRIDPAEWSNAVRIADLPQQIPDPQAPHPFRTEVLLQSDEHHLYLAFVCHDPDPRAIAIHTRRPDDDMGGDDTVAFALDAFGDQRTGYFFRVNAAGARQDGLISQATDDPSTDWTGIWNAHAGRFPGGWTVEIVIPVRTLNFRRGLTEWRVNFERHIARQRITLNWAAPQRDALFTDLSRAGRLTGIRFENPGLGLELVPYALGKRLIDFGAGPAAYRALGGLDAGWRITPDLNLVVTTNTDFAETEVDLRQNNTTRFPLFFPERRAFFLEGSSQFNFGLGLDASFIPFFSRRIGLANGQPVPIDVGARLLGRVGRWNLGIMNAQTRGIAGQPAANLTAARVSYDVSKELRIGGIATNGDPNGVSRNRFAGVDAVWRTSKFRGNRNLQFGGWAGRSGGERSSTGNGYGVALEYPNDRWWSSTRIQHFDANLRPALGFLPRGGVTRYLSENWFQPRPRADGPFGFLRQAYYGATAEAVVNRFGQTESWSVRLAPLSWEFQSGDALEAFVIPQHEYLPVPFSIAPGLTLPIGHYPFTRWSVNASSSRFRRWRASATSEAGGFYSGRLWQTQAAFDWNSPDGRWQYQISQEQNFGRLREGSFVQRLWLGRVVFSPNPYLSLTSLLQYDSTSANFGGNTRLQWTIRPGRELIFVWNRGWRRLTLRRDDLTLLPESEALIVKLRWTIRL
jgi:hypothetical protein